METTKLNTDKEDDLESLLNRNIYYQDFILLCIEDRDTMNLKLLLSDDNYINESYLSQQSDVQYFLHQINDAFILILENEGSDMAESIVPRVIEFIVNRFAEQDEVLDVDAVHSSLAYQGNNSLYKAILQYLTDQDFLLESLIDTEQEEKYLTLFQSHLAGLYRREGDLKKATELLVACERRMEAKNNGKAEYLKELSLVEYELAFVYLLRGKGEKAYDFFGQSVIHSTEANHIIGELISGCAQKRHGYLYGISGLEEYEETVSNALLKFEKLRENSPFAQRWVFNCLVNLFRVSFYKKDRGGMEKYYSILQKNDWKQKYNYHSSPHLLSMEPRMLAMQGNLIDAIEKFKFLPQNEAELTKQFQEVHGTPRFDVYFEGIAEFYFDLANIYTQLNQIDNAVRFLNLGLLVPSFGNVNFHNWIRKRLNDIA